MGEANVRNKFRLVNPPKKRDKKKKIHLYELSATVIQCMARHARQNYDKYEGASNLVRVEVKPIKPIEEPYQNFYLIFLETILVLFSFFNSLPLSKRTLVF